MKIGIDARAADWYRGTGIGNYTYQLIKNINTLKSANDYLLFLPEKFNCDFDFNPNIQIKNIANEQKNDFWNEVNIPNILQGSEVELYHIPQNGIGLPIDLDCPSVITLHDIIPYKMPETVGPRYIEIFLREMPNIIKKTDAIITVSNYSKEDIASTLNFPREKIYVTHLAAESIYRPLNKEMCRNFLKQNYYIDKDYILYIGGYSPRKNIIGLMESFARLIKEDKKDLYLVIVGTKGISYPIYKEKAEKLNITSNVIFTGFIPLEHLPIFYNGAKVFAYPSFYEGFGLPPIEAMACGTPVITSTATSIPEVVDDAGILIPPDDIDSLYISLLNVLEDTILREKLINSGFKRSAKLSWESTAINTLNAYNSIIKNL